MREPPPSPLDTSASSPRKPQKLYNPCSPSLGSQKFFLMRYGLRGNEPGGYGLPRSRRQTRRSASARRYAITEPPKPDPITTASKCVSFISVPCISTLALSRLLGDGSHLSIALLFIPRYVPDGDESVMNLGLAGRTQGVFAPLRAGIDQCGIRADERDEMDDAMQQRLITFLAAGIAYVISHQLTERFIDIPDQRGIKDDILEAVLKGVTTATSTILASMLVRRLFKG